MLKIRLTRPLLVKNHYQFFIDSDNKKSFSNKREAENYTRQAESNINEAFIFLNEEYSSIQQFYRTYFFADRDIRFKAEVENCFGFIDNRLKFISFHTDSLNYNTIIIQSLFGCFNELLNASMVIKKKAVGRYDMLTKHRISIRIKVIKSYLKDFNIKNSESNQEIKLKAI